jgi:thiol-disulfide isomerase/thioredoxin
MSPGFVIIALAGLIAFATILGLIWKNTTGRVRSAGDRAEFVRLPDVPLDSRATLLQFSTEVCAPCVPTRRVLAQVADETAGVRHIDLDVTNRPDLAARFNILQTPTTFILDGSGAIRARIGGAPKPADVRTALDLILT